MKAAVYCATRNIYYKIIPSLKSLLFNSSVEKVFLLVEDDHPDIGIPDWAPVEYINVSGQEWFPKAGANSNSWWTYMVLMRIVLCKLLLDLDKVLSLDCDTIINENVDELWNLSLADNYFAAVRETHRVFPIEPYFNAGVVLWNLKQMRDGKADEIVTRLNTVQYTFPDQDAMNIMCHDRTIELRSWYNANRFTTPTDRPKIFHYAATGTWYEHEPLVQKYKAMRWEDIYENRPD